jgi:hypothetical protein
VKLTESQKILAPRGFGLDFAADILVDGKQVDRLPIAVGGDLTIDFNSAIRRRCNLVVPGLEKWIPLSGNDPLFPVNRYEVGLRAFMDFRGIDLADVPLGVFRVQKPRVAITNTGDRAIQFDGYDRGLTVSRYKLERSVTWKAGVKTRPLLEDLISDRLPASSQLVFDVLDSEFPTVTVPFQWDLGTDVWEESVKLVRQFGLDLYMSDEGDCVIDDVVEAAAVQSAFVHKSGSSATILSTERSLDDENSYNWIIIQGQNTTTNVEVFGEAFDTDPSSLTYIGASKKTDPDFGQSAFGAKLNIISNQVVQTTSQANKAAVAELKRSVGIEEQLEVESIWLPHDVNESITFQIPELGVADTYALDAVRLPLDPTASINMTTRRRRTEGV